MADLDPPSTGIDTAALRAAIDGAAPEPAPRARVRLTTIEIEGDALALSSALGTALAHLLPRIDDQPTVTGSGGVHMPESIEPDAE